MFLATQFLGLYVVNFYSPIKIVNNVPTEISAPNIPYFGEQTDLESNSDFLLMLPIILFAFVGAILLVLFLTKFNADLIMKIWFFLVVIFAMAISFNAILPYSKYLAIICLVIAAPLAFVKIFGRGFIIHNFTELFIYPGVAAVFVPLLNLYTLIFLLILISIYDIWAVWKSGIMQKMAEYQITKLNIFSGFFVPYIDKKILAKLKKAKKKNKKVKVNIAMLGGGDVVFPIIASGVMLKTLGLYSSVLVIVGATLGLSYLFFFSEKKKFYPAMPFISAGILAGILLSYVPLW